MRGEGGFHLDSLHGVLCEVARCGGACEYEREPGAGDLVCVRSRDLQRFQFVGCGVQNCGSVGDLRLNGVGGGHFVPFCASMMALNLTPSRRAVRLATAVRLMRVRRWLASASVMSRASPLSAW